MIELHREDTATNFNHIEGLLKHKLQSYPPSKAEFDPAYNEMYLRPGHKTTLLSLMKKQANIDEWSKTVEAPDL